MASEHYLVTGAAGFIGQHLVHGLRESGAEVTALVRRHSQAERLKKQQTKVVVGDLSDRDKLRQAVDGVDGIFHLASAVSTRSAKQSREVNVTGTGLLAEVAAGQLTPPKLVYVSSLAAAGPSGEAPHRESDPSRPVSAYGKTKLAAEQSLAAFADRMPISIARPPGVFGPGDRNLLTLYKSIQSGWNAYAVSANYEYSFVSVTDLVEGLLAISKSGQRIPPGGELSAGTYYLADPQAMSFRELGDVIGQIVGARRVRHLRIPAGGCWALATFPEMWQRLSGAKTYFNYDKVREATAGSWVCSVEKAKQDLRFEPRMGLVERLAETYEWYCGQGWLKRR